MSVPHGTNFFISLPAEQSPAIPCLLILFDLFAAKKLQTVRSEICPAIAISAI